MVEVNTECKHEGMETVEHKGKQLVVCHDCKRTLGLKTEVYSRVVGYLRPVAGYNKGKKEEFKVRKTYVDESLQQEQIA